MKKIIARLVVPSLALTLAVGAATLLFGQATQPAAPATPAGDKVVTPSGLTIVVTEKSRGAQMGDVCQILYTGKLTDGHVFDASSRHGNAPLPVKLGAGGIIKGLEEGIIGMNVGEKRKLIIPPNLAYGEKGRGEIPPNATLEFDIEMLSLERRTEQ